MRLVKKLYVDMLFVLKQSNFFEQRVSSRKSKENQTTENARIKIYRGKANKCENRNTLRRIHIHLACLRDARILA